MENNSKSGLRISEIIATLGAFIVISTSTQLLFNTENSKIEKANFNEQIAEEQTKQEELSKETIVQEKTVQRVATITSRSGIKRETTEKQEEASEENLLEENSQIETVEEAKQYITIEEIKISKDMDLTLRCGISKEDFKQLIENVEQDTTKFFYNNSDIIYDLCEKYELNEIFFCGLIAGESGWNISKSHRTKCNYISMMSKGKLIKYSTPEEGLEAAAKLLHNKYLTKGGAYYSGKTLANVQKVFCPNSSTWVNLVYGCMKQIVK